MKSVCFGDRRREMLHVEMLERSGVCFGTDYANQKRGEVSALVMERETERCFIWRDVRAKWRVLW